MVEWLEKRRLCRRKSSNFPNPQYFLCWKRWWSETFRKILGSAQKWPNLAKIWPNIAITPKRFMQSTPNLRSCQKTFFYVPTPNFIKIYAAKKFLWRFENFENFENFQNAIEIFLLHRFWWNLARARGITYFFSSQDAVLIGYTV